MDIATIVKKSQTLRAESLRLQAVLKNTVQRSIKLCARSQFLAEGVVQRIKVASDINARY